MLPTQLYLATPFISGAYSFGGLAESHLIPPPSLHGRKGPLFQVVYHPVLWLTLNLWLVLNLLILEWWCGIRLMNLLNLDGRVLHCMITHLSWFHRQGVHVNPLPNQSRLWGLLLLDPSVDDFEHGLDSILTDSTDTTKLDASFDEADTIPSSVSSNIFCLVTKPDTHQAGRKLAGGASTSTTDSRKKGGHDGPHFNVVQSSTSSP